MPETTGLLSQFYIRLDGQDLPEALVRSLTEASVETSLHLPDVATLILRDPSGEWTDDPRVTPGKSVEVIARTAHEQHRLFDGEIVELEADFVAGGRRLVVRAFDRLHRLARGRLVRSFVNVSDSDLVQQLAREVGLHARVEQTRQVHPYVLQDNQTNLEFLRSRAAGLGWLLFVEGKTLHCEPPGKAGSTVALTWGETLNDFHPRLTTVGQVDGAVARGWDPGTRQEIVGRARNGRGAPSIGEARPGGSVAHDAFGQAAEMLVTDRAIRTQAQADQLAQAVVDRLTGRFVEAEGIAGGNPNLVAGASVRLDGIGRRFGGTYFVTGATHVYSAAEGYTTRFVVSGHEPATLLSALGPDSPALQARIGLAIGIVTDNSDPDGQGRVKVRFPTLSAEHASHWARLATPGGGPNRGLELLPEVNDEVLVGFEHGDVHHAYVLGGLWNGRDAPPRRSDQVIGGGRVQQRILRSRTGHIITLDDSDDQPGISIVDQTGRNTIRLDSKRNTLTVSFDGDMDFNAGGHIRLSAQGKVSLSGASVDVDALNALSLKGTSAALEASGQTTIKGALINLN